MCSVTPDSGPSQLSIILSVSTVMAQTSNARLWNVRIYQVLSLYTVISIHNPASVAASLPITNILLSPLLPLRRRVNLGSRQGNRSWLFTLFNVRKSQDPIITKLR